MSSATHTRVLLQNDKLFGVTDQCSGPLDRLYGKYNRQDHLFRSADCGFNMDRKVHNGSHRWLAPWK